MPPGWPCCWSWRRALTYPADAQPDSGATDAEEWGMIGARELAGLLKRHHAAAVISIKYVMAGPPRALEMSCTGQFAGYRRCGCGSC